MKSGYRLEYYLCIGENRDRIFTGNRSFVLFLPFKAMNLVHNYISLKRSLFVVCFLGTLILFLDKYIEYKHCNVYVEHKLDIASTSY